MWVSQTGFNVLGSRFRLRSQDERTASILTELLSPFARPSVAAPARNGFDIVATDDELTLYVDCSRSVRGDTGDVVLHAIMELNRRAVGEYRGFAAHAAVIGTASGAVAALGESGAGKTTLTGHSLLQGMAYGSDEALCIDYGTGEVQPYPKPLSLSALSWKLLGLEFPPGFRDEAPAHPAGLTDRVMTEPQQLEAVILLDRRDESETALEPVPSSAVMAGLLQNSFNHYKAGRSAFELAAAIARDVPGYVLRYDDAGEAAAVLKEQLGGGVA